MKGGEIIMAMYILPNDDISYLENLLFINGNFQILPYAILKDIPQEHISIFCVKHAFYCFPTQELIDYLREEIADKEAIEIGSGNGFVAQALQITATDSMQQTNPAIQQIYAMAQQPTITYGTNVKPFEALNAIDYYTPQVVLGCWVTHLYNSKEHWREGNAAGIDEIKIIKKHKYIFVGNELTHQFKPILKHKHQIFKAEWLMSRSMQKEKNVIWTWDNN